MLFPDRSVWVSDSQKLFVEHSGMGPNVLYMMEKEPLVIPCRVTYPNITTTLAKVRPRNLKLVLYLKSHPPLCKPSFSRSLVSGIHYH